MYVPHCAPLSLLCAPQGHIRRGHLSITPWGGDARIANAPPSCAHPLSCPRPPFPRSRSQIRESMDDDDGTWELGTGWTLSRRHGLANHLLPGGWEVISDSDSAILWRSAVCTVLRPRLSFFAP